MKVFIKNKLISWGGSSTVVNENEEPVFKVKGKIFSPTKKKKIYDMEGNLLYTVRNKYWTAFTRRVLINDADKNRVATIKKGKYSINSRFEIEDNEDAMEISGKIFSRTSKIIRNGEEVATITREFTFIRDAFCLEANEEEIAFMTALVIGFDNMKDDIQDDD